MDRDLYQKALQRIDDERPAFSDDYFDWLDECGLIWSFHDALAFAFNISVLRLPLYFWGEEDLAKAAIEYVVECFDSSDDHKEAWKTLDPKSSLTTGERATDWPNEYVALLNEYIWHLLIADDYYHAKERRDLAMLSILQSAETIGALNGTVLRYEIEGESRKAIAAMASNARHSKPGGSRAKREAIRSAWASGKYTSRDICAEQECAAHGMSFSSARKALRNTPDPM